MTTPSVRILAEGVGFAEGPVAADGAVFVTSIDQGRVYRIDADGADVHAETGGGANGAVIDADGVLFIAQNGGRFAADGPCWPPSSVGGIQRVDPDGVVTWVTRDPIAPNDLCFGPDGLLYSTDPTRAPRSEARPIDGRIWRTDPRTGATELLLSVPWFTNGIAFGPDGRLYVAATHSSQIHAFDVVEGGLRGGEVVITMAHGAPDGLAFDDAGDLVVGAVSLTGGLSTIQTWTTGGDLVGTFRPGDGAHYTNIAFTPGGDLLITDATEGRVLLAEGWPRSGLPLHPFR